MAGINVLRIRVVRSEGCPASMEYRIDGIRIIAFHRFKHVSYFAVVNHLPPPMVELMEGEASAEPVA